MSAPNEHDQSHQTPQKEPQDVPVITPENGPGGYNTWDTGGRRDTTSLTSWNRSPKAPRGSTL